MKYETVKIVVLITSNDINVVHLNSHNNRYKRKIFLSLVETFIIQSMNCHVSIYMNHFPFTSIVFTSINHTTENRDTCRKLSRFFVRRTIPRVLIYL